MDLLGLLEFYPDPFAVFDEFPVVDAQVDLLLFFLTFFCRQILEASYSAKWKSYQRILQNFDPRRLRRRVEIFPDRRSKWRCQRLRKLLIRRTIEMFVCLGQTDEGYVLLSKLS